MKIITLILAAIAVVMVLLPSEVLYHSIVGTPSEQDKRRYIAEYEVWEATETDRKDATEDSFQPSWGAYTSTGGKISTGFQVAPNMFVDTNSGGITFGYGF